MSVQKLDSGAKARKKSAPRVEVLRVGRGPYFVYIDNKLLTDESDVGCAFSTKAAALKAAKLKAAFSPGSDLGSKR